MMVERSGRRRRREELAPCFPGSIRRRRCPRWCRPWRGSCPAATTTSSGRAAGMIRRQWEATCMRREAILPRPHYRTSSPQQDYRSGARTCSGARPWGSTTRPRTPASRRSRRRRAGGTAACGSGRGASGPRRSATRTRPPACGSARSRPPRPPRAPTTRPRSASAAAAPSSTSPRTRASQHRPPPPTRRRRRWLPRPRWPPTRPAPCRTTCSTRCFCTEEPAVIHRTMVAGAAASVALLLRGPTLSRTPVSPSPPCRPLLPLLQVTAAAQRRSSVTGRSGHGRRSLRGPTQRRRVLGPVRASIRRHLVLKSSSCFLVFPFPSRIKKESGVYTDGMVSVQQHRSGNQRKGAPEYCNVRSFASLMLIM